VLASVSEPLLVPNERRKGMLRSKTHVLKILDDSGHTAVEWKPGEASETEARQEFDRIVKGNFGTAYAVETKQGRRLGEKIEEFDPQADEIIVHRELVGG
jgi:hypothetical protein